eukprot:11135749-Alexandrium_andersonii.AAC.1
MPADNLLACPLPSGSICQRSTRLPRLRSRPAVQPFTHGLRSVRGARSRVSSEASGSSAHACFAWPAAHPPTHVSCNQQFNHP